MAGDLLIAKVVHISPECYRSSKVYDKEKILFVWVQFLMLAEPCELQEAIKFYDLGSEAEAGPDSISQMKSTGLQNWGPASKPRLKIRFL